MERIVSRLRQRQSVKILQKKTGLIHHFQLNKKTSFICWERWVRFPHSKAVCHNSYLSLKDVMTLITKLNQKKYDEI